MKNSIMKLVKSFSETQMEMMNKIKMETKDKETAIHKVLEVALKGKINQVSHEDAVNLYGKENESFLTEVDYVIANLLINLEQLTGKPIAEEYEDAIVLGQEDPEVDYLANVIYEYLYN